MSGHEFDEFEGHSAYHAAAADSHAAWQLTAAFDRDEGFLAGLREFAAQHPETCPCSFCRYRREIGWPIMDDLAALMANPDAEQIIGRACDYLMQEIPSRDEDGTLYPIQRPGTPAEDLRASGVRLLPPIPGVHLCERCGERLGLGDPPAVHREPCQPAS